MDPTPNPSWQWKREDPFLKEPLLVELNTSFPPGSIFKVKQLEDLKTGKLKVDPRTWISILRSSGVSSEWEQFLGIEVIERYAKSGKWASIPERPGMEALYEAGYMTQRTANGKKYALPTKKLAEFVQSRLK